MDVQHILQKLRQTPYKFTEAAKMRDIIKNMPEDQRDSIVQTLRNEASKDFNFDISAVLREIVSDLGRN
jgi:hypothetical protein